MKKLPIRRKNRTNQTNETVSSNKKISFGQTVVLLLFSGAVLLGASGYYWYNNILTNPDRIISDMLDKSMQTTSLNRTVTQASGDSSVNQVINTSFTPALLSQSSTDLSELSDIGRTSVTTETIGTPNADYVRYTDIKIQNGSTQKQNFDNVLNVWGKRNSSPETGQDVSFLNEALFVAVPFGNLNADQRSQIKSEINRLDLYRPTSSELVYVNGRPQLNYTVDLNAKSLVTVLAKYVDVTGVGNKNDLNPDSYPEGSKIRVIMNIDALSRHLRGIDFASSGRKEVYHSYNVATNVKLPDQTVDVNELQSRLSQVESGQQR